jgi:2-iminobutanoate/2-iminopropanoate deaminase
LRRVAVGLHAAGTERGAMTERRSIHIDGFAHVNPIPAGCLYGNFLITGAITGMDPVTHQMAETLEAQVANIFHHMREIVTRAGGSPKNIVKVTVWHSGILNDPAQRAVVNREWIKMFPDEDSRPARHAVKTELEPGRHLLCDLTAIIA